MTLQSGTSKDATVPYVVEKLLADEKVKTEQRGDKLFCVVIEYKL